MKPEYLPRQVESCEESFHGLRLLLEGMGRAAVDAGKRIELNRLLEPCDGELLQRDEFFLEDDKWQLLLGNRRLVCGHHAPSAGFIAFNIRDWSLFRNDLFIFSSLRENVFSAIIKDRGLRLEKCFPVRLLLAGRAKSGFFECEIPAHQEADDQEPYCGTPPDRACRRTLGSWAARRGRSTDASVAGNVTAREICVLTKTLEMNCFVPAKKPTHLLFSRHDMSSIAKRYEARGRRLPELTLLFRGKRIAAPLDKPTWGPVLWRWLHMLSVSGDPQAVVDALIALQRLIPCHECRKHFLRYLRRVPPLFGTKGEAISYLYNMHNSVNNRLGKPQFSREDFRREYGVAPPQA